MSLSPLVLYNTYDDSIWLPLRSLYYSNDTKIIISKNTNNIIVEIISHYCTQCCNKYNDNEAISYRNTCPYCYDCPRCRSTVSLYKKSENLYVFTCGYCYWKSIDIIISNISKENIYNVINNLHYDRNQDVYKLYNQLLTEYNNQSIRKSNSLTNLSTNHLAITSTNVTHESNSNLDLPLYKQLKSKKMLRCKEDYINNRMSILIHPNIDPLEGDSSKRTKRGKWWSKDTSAIYEIPNITLLDISNVYISNANSFIKFVISNPKDVNVDISISFKLHSNNYYTIVNNNPYVNEYHHQIVPDVSSESYHFILQPYVDELLKDDDHELSKKKSSDNIINDNNIYTIIDNCVYITLPVNVVYNNEYDHISTACLDITITIDKIDDAITINNQPIPIKLIIPLHKINNISS